MDRCNVCGREKNEYMVKTTMDQFDNGGLVCIKCFKERLSVE